MIDLILCLIGLSILIIVVAVFFTAEIEVIEYEVKYEIK